MVLEENEDMQNNKNVHCHINLIQTFHIKYR